MNATNSRHDEKADPLADLLLEVAQECRLCPVESLLGLIVRRLSERPNVALARIWLIRPGDICPECPVRDECPDQSSCLHLVSSAGVPREDFEADWSRVDGDFRRFPLGVRKVGRSGATGEAIVVEDIEKDGSWIARPEWAAKEGIRGFCAQPLVYREEVIGVLGVFVRVPLSKRSLGWIRLLADHAATAIANARAYEEIDHLRAQLQMENEYLREEVREAQEFGAIVGGGPAVGNLLDQIRLVAPTDASVLILGESGTGKELIAREIHRLSGRSERPMIKVNCASIPRELYESEFFGHAKGAFTGALKERAGRFEASDGGTLFLDEVGEIPLELQGKLLRVLQEGEYERLGEERTRRADVRIVAATNRDIKKEVEEGRFRQDLYYRLNVFPVEVVPLRSRKEDIPALAEHFLRLASEKFRRPAPRLTQAALMALQHYEWPGNVRELQNVIERSVISASGGRFEFVLPAEGVKEDTAQGPMSVVSFGSDAEPEVATEEEMQLRQRENTRLALERAGWRIYGHGAAAELLGVKPTTLVSRIRKMGLKKPAS